jgi:glycosyltransferase involved in cell wall biosynthesis
LNQRRAKNLGPSISRKVGLDNSDGEYIQYVDGDDWIEKDMLEKMWTKAASGGFDMVVCNYFYEKPGYVTYERQEIGKMEKLDMIKDIAVMKKLACAVWNKMVRRGILSRIRFPTQNYSEDRFITLQTTYYSERIGYIEDALYHYRYNINSISLDVNNNDIIDNKFEVETKMRNCHYKFFFSKLSDWSDEKEMRILAFSGEK